MIIFINKPFFILNMGHITSKGYKDLQKRLNKSIQGAPESETLFKILEQLFTQQEAKTVSLLPLNFFTVEEAMKIIEKNREDTIEILDGLATKMILFDCKKGDSKAYIMAAPMAGFIEYSLMRTDGKFNTKLLSELYHQYINVETEFMTQVFGLDPAMDRTFVHEDMIQEKDQSIVLDYERASKVIDDSECITVGRCYCRHKMAHLGKACGAPENVCLTFNNPAKNLIKQKIAKEITKEEAHKIIKECMEYGLVQIGDNVQDRVGWICNCCGCCCEALLAYKKLGTSDKINTNFYAKLIPEECTGCSVCKIKCPVDAIEMINGKAFVDEDRCIGCGVCARFCPTKTLKLERRKETKFVPKDIFERYVISAINEGKLQNFIFGNQNLWTHKLMRRFVGFFLKLKLSKKILVQNQMQSKYLQWIVKTYYKFNKKDYGEMPDYSHPEMKRKL